MTSSFHEVSPPTEKGGADRLLRAVEIGDTQKLRRLLRRRRRRPTAPAVAAAAMAPALHASCRLGNLRSAELLLKRGGADPNLPAEPGFGVTPLMVAAREGCEALARLLLDCGADPDRTTVQGGQTALMLAACCGHAAVVRLLLEHRGGGCSGEGGGGGGGRRSAARCLWRGWTAVQYAEASGNEETVRMLGPRLPPLAPAALSRIPIPRVQAESQLMSSWQQLGRGSFASVYRVQGRDSSPMAVKVLRPGYGHSSAANLLRELAGAEFLVGLRHDNVVRYLGFSQQPDGGLRIFMEFIEGRTLAEIATDADGGTMAEGAGVRGLLAQMVRGLAYIHGCSPPVIHRDVKGSNVMVTSRDGVAKLIDFGLAIQLLPPTPSPTTASTAAQRLTIRRGSVVGTPGYMAPEVWRDQRYSDKSDVYALGCTLFEMLSGAPPHGHSDNHVRLAYAAVHFSMPPLPTKDVGLREIYQLCTAHAAEARPSAAALLQHPWLINCV